MPPEPDFQRSSYCADGQCVEVGFQRSSFCSSAACVEVSHAGGQVHVRDSKNPDQAALVFTCDEWAVFVKGVKAGEFEA